MEGFVYKWTNKSNGKWYIGSHKGSSDDGYLGSGWDFKDAIKSEGIQNFDREILYEGENFREEEDLILKKLKAKSDPNSYNLTNQACGFPTGENHPGKRPEVAAKISKALKGKTWEEILGKEESIIRREKQRKALKGTKTGENNPAKRPEVRQKISNTLKGTKPSWTGKPKPPEQLAKIYVSRYCKDMTEYEKREQFKIKLKQYSRIK